MTFVPRPLLAYLTIALVATGTACGGSDGATEPVSSPGDPVSLSIQSGSDQTGVVAEELPDPLVAQVQDGDGQPVADVTVSWVVTAGGGSVFAPATETGGDGTTQNRWTLGEVAGAQEVDVRWVDPETGDASVIGSFRATAEAGPAVTFSVAGDTIRTLVVGDTSRVLLEGEDEFGNAIEAGDIDASWISSDPAVATVDGAGLITGQGDGETTVSARTDSDSARVIARVNPNGTTVFETPGIVAHFQAGGGRFLGFGQTTVSGTTEGAVFTFDGDTWTEELRTDRSMANGWVFAGAEAWFGSLGSDTKSVWRSQVVGTWNVVPDNPDRGILTGHSSGLIAHLTTTIDPSTNANLPRLWTWSNGAWTDLGSPPARGDSTWQVTSLAGVTVGIRAKDEIYIGGHLESRRGSGTGRAIIAMWNGSDWSFPTMPAEAFEGRTSVVTHLSADPTGGPLHGLLVVDEGTVRRTFVVGISGGTVTLVDNPLSDAGIEMNLSGLHVGPSGNLYLNSPDRIIWEDGTGWEEFFAPSDWIFRGPTWVEENGTLWLSALRRTEGGEQSAVLRRQP